MGLWATFEDTTVEKFRRVIDVDLMGRSTAPRRRRRRLRRAAGFVTAEPRPASAPEDLFAPIPGHDTVSNSSRAAGTA